MSQLLPPKNIFDFTPPSSPTRLFETMKWLKRTPSSVPLPPSPTKSPTENLGDGDQPDSSVKPTASTESAATEAMMSLRNQPSMLSLQPKASTLPLASPLSSPQHEVSRWLFRSSPVQALASTTPSSELEDHFARSSATYEEKEAKLRRRAKASRLRVKVMRTWLHASSAPNNEKLKEQEMLGRLHQRIDSGSHEHTEDFVLAHPDKIDTATGSNRLLESPKNEIPPLHEDFLWLNLFRLRTRTYLRFDCVGCGNTHTDSVQDRKSVVWLLHGCRHLVAAGCLHRLQDHEEGQDEGCHNCAHLRLTIKGVDKEEFEGRCKRLLEGTRSV